MREKKIGILCLQETHLTQEHENQINALYSRRLKILNSRDEERPSTSAGVAFILNRELTNTDNIELKEIIPGRALALKTQWHNNDELNILNVYAPNDPTKHSDFWKQITDAWTERDARRLDIMLGDFNLTEDPLDRAPARTDNETAIEALRDLRDKLNIHDSWRKTHPDSRLFTYYSNMNSYSRLDRIYSSPAHDQSLHDWSSCTSAIPTDHRMLLVRYAPPKMPHIGNGRWSWPLGHINDKTLITKMSNLGSIAQLRIERNLPNPTEENDPQSIWEDFKTKIRQESPFSEFHPSQTDSPE
ncbi:Endonuclease/exonuclease/phosphatase [Suillus tomentosus]|nr:Endonuclease/exonuclease/phosphatase [Suillus tomentosus]